MTTADGALAVVTPRTVVEGFLPWHGEVELGPVYDTANAVGVSDQPLRLAIRRMIAAGDVEQSGRGRRGTLRLTALGRRRLQLDRAALGLADAQDAGAAPWDGTWQLLAVSASEQDRAVRDGVRRVLLAAGAATVSTSLYLSPHDLTALLDEQQRSHLVVARADHVDVRGVTEPRALAEHLWPAAPVEQGYAAVAAVLDAPPAPDVLVQQVRLAGALEAGLRHDPLLPLELRRSPWPPSRLRRRWRAAWGRLAEQAGGSGLYRGWLDP